MKPDFATYFLEGVRHFNACEFWEAHESWETIWLAAESDAEQFLQGMIQIAAAYHHVKRGTYRGAIRLFDAGLRRLQPFAPGYSDLDRTDVETAAGKLREALAGGRTDEIQFPKLKLLREQPAPPVVQW